MSLPGSAVPAPTRSPPQTPAAGVGTVWVTGPLAPAAQARGFAGPLGQSGRRRRPAATHVAGGSDMTTGPRSSADDPGAARAHLPPGSEIDVMTIRERAAAHWCMPGRPATPLADRRYTNRARRVAAPRPH